MTGPGEGDSLEPWGRQEPEPEYAPPEYPDEPPARRGRTVVMLAIAAVVLAGAGTAIWFFTGGPGHTATPRAAAAATSDPPAPSAPTTGASSGTHPGGPVPTGTSGSAAPSGANSPSAYDVGSCFDEQAGQGAGKVQLNPVPCGGDQSVFVINRVVTNAADCDSGADYHQHGYEVPDVTVGVTYCASLVVPANVCFVLGGTAPIARATCGSSPDVVTVQSIESAPNVTSACADKVNPDVWYYQSPSSGQFACVSRPATPTSAPTTTR
jgi:hypothetical protein